jgi:DNA-binding SARP family transcriptional activator
MDEAETRERMRALAQAGDYAGALSAYVELEGRLAAELKVKPEPETRRLLEEIRRDAPPPLGTGPR